MKNESSIFWGFMVIINLLLYYFIPITAITLLITGYAIRANQPYKWEWDWLYKKILNQNGKTNGEWIKKCLLLLAESILFLPFKPIIYIFEWLGKSR